MLHFWAALGCAMVDRYFWEHLDRYSQPSKRLRNCRELWDHLGECKLRLSRYEVMEINRIIQRDNENGAKYLQRIRVRFRDDSIRFPDDLNLCGVLGHALVDQEFAEELHGKRRRLNEIEEYVQDEIKISLEHGELVTISRFFQAEYEPSVANDYEYMYQLLHAANSHNWVKPEEESIYALSPDRGQCGESPIYSVNYIHITGPDIRLLLMQLETEGKRKRVRDLLRRLGLQDDDLTVPDDQIVPPVNRKVQKTAETGQDVNVAPSQSSST